jgi:dTDP-4-amino-4,6-dideoxygalactose transaminase
VIPQLDLVAQHKSIKEELDRAIGQVVASGNYILGPNVEALEREVASYCGTAHGVGVASGTDALHLALIACGVKEGDEVITTPFSFIATADTIAQVGAVPVFVDINPRAFNLDENKIEHKITARTKAIVVVHLYGQPARMDKIMTIAEEYGIKVIEDCAQAMGAEFQGRKVGSIGHAGCFSFFPTKNLGCMGDGGMVVTDDDEIAERVRMLRVHGQGKKYQSEILGFNSRLDEIQAAILRVKLKYLDTWNAERQNKASLYSRLLRDAPVVTPLVEEDTKHVFHQYTIRAPRRDELAKELEEKGIGVAIYYPVPFHLQKVFGYLGYQKGALPESEKGAREVLSLPIYPELEDSQVEEVAKEIKAFY